MKVKYVGPVYEVYVPRIGRFIRGREYEFPDDVAMILLGNTGFRRVDPPKRVRRRRRRVTAPKPPKPKVEEKIVEEKPEEVRSWTKSKKQEPVEADPQGEEEEIKIEKETPKEV